MSTWVVEEPKWQWTIQQSLSQFQDQGILCDTSLACANGTTLRAHSCVLAAASKHIRTLLNGAQSNDYTLLMDSVTSTTWQYILRFIYDGRVALPLDQVEQVKDAAIRFQIDPLINLLNTLERLKGQLASAEQSTDRRTSESCQGQGDVIVLDDDDDDDDGVVVVESVTDVASGVMADDPVSVAASDNVEFTSSSLQSSRLPTSNDCTVSSVVPHSETAPTLRNACADVAPEDPRVRILETHDTDAGDNASDICCQRTNTDGVLVLSESGSSSLISSVQQNTGPRTVLHDASRSSDRDADEAFDVSEVVCMDSQTSNGAKDASKAVEESYNWSEGASQDESLPTLANFFSPAALPMTSSCPQPAPFASSPPTDIYHQFTVSKPMRRILPKCGNTVEGTSEPALETVATDKKSVPSKRGPKRRMPMTPVATSETCTKPFDNAAEYGNQRLYGLPEPGASGDQHGQVNGPQEGPENRPWEDQMENEAPLLCISNVVSLSGQVSDFTETCSAFISSDNDLRNPTAEVKIATDNDLRSRTSSVKDYSSAATPFMSVSPTTIVENNQIANSTMSESAHTTQVSSCTEVIPRTEVPLSKPALHINLPSSVILSKGVLDGSNSCASDTPSSGVSDMPSGRRALRFLLLRSAQPPGKVVFPLPSTQTSRNSEQLPKPNCPFPNVRLVSLPSDSQNSTLSQSRVSSISRVDWQFPVPSAVPFPTVPRSDLVEEFPVPCSDPFPLVPLSGHGREFTFPPSDPFPIVPHTGCVEEFPVPSVPLQVPSPVVPLLDHIEEFPVPSVPFPSIPLTGGRQPTPRGRPRKNILTFSVESTTPQWPRSLKKSVTQKPGPKRRKPATPLEPDESPLVPSDSASEYAWPGENRRFDGCTKLTTDHDYQQKSPSSLLPLKVKRLPLKARKLSEPTSIFGSSGGNLDFCGAFVDETSFVPPDSTVLETRPLPTGSDVYNFTESDGELNVVAGKPQSSISSTQPTGTILANGKEVKRRGRKPGQKCPKQPTPKKATKQRLPHEEETPKKIRRMRKVPPVHESGGSRSSHGPHPEVKFVGRDIRHEWVMSSEPRSTQWYTGRVLSVVSGTDGEIGSQYEVKYEGEEMPYLVDHLLEDYLDGSLHFV